MTRTLAGRGLMGHGRVSLLATLFPRASVERSLIQTVLVSPSNHDFLAHLHYGAIALMLCGAGYFA